MTLFQIYIYINNICEDGYRQCVSEHMSHITVKYNMDVFVFGKHVVESRCW